MPKYDNLIKRILSGRSDQNISFNDLCSSLKNLRFEERVKGDHHIFFKVDVEEIINIQPIGKMAKSYQVKQIRHILLKNKLGGPDESA
jgi:hypothetical protein